MARHGEKATESHRAVDRASCLRTHRVGVLSPLKSPTDAVHILIGSASPSLGCAHPRSKRVRPRSLISWSVGVVVVTLLVLSSLGVFSSTKAPKETVVSSITSSRYGSVLVVGGNASSGLHNFPLYEFSGDVGHHFGCATNKIVAYDLGAKESVPLTCTGPEEICSRTSVPTIGGVYDQGFAGCRSRSRREVAGNGSSPRHRQADHLRRSSVVPV